MLGLSVVRNAGLLELGPSLVCFAVLHHSDLSLKVSHKASMEAKRAEKRQLEQRLGTADSSAGSEYVLFSGCSSRLKPILAPVLRYVHGSRR